MRRPLRAVADEGLVSAFVVALLGLFVVCGGLAVDGGRIAAVFMSGPLGIAKIGYKSGKDVTWRFSFNAALPVLPGFAAQREFSL